MVIATRGERLALSRTRFSPRDQRPGAFHVELLDIVEINADGLIVARVSFDLDDIDAAFAELDARYVAGEAETHSRTWALVAETFAGFNRHDLAPTTPDWVNIDRRSGITFPPGEMIEFLHAAWEVAPDVRYRIESVHRLNQGAAVVMARRGRHLPTRIQRRVA